jgi:SAM-dependent methyltransferase
MGVLQPVLMARRQMRILDVGCGQAGLLRTLFQQYPENSYYAVDPNVSSAQLADKQIHFSDDWKSLEGTFDLIILSHTIEHLVDFDDIAELSGRLSSTGQLYIEVPDAATYIDYQRREFLYYFDRLHINHFTRQSLLRLVGQLGLSVVDAGRNDFDYKDGAPYPAIYVRATPMRTARLEDNAIACSLFQRLQNYIATESVRVKALQLKLLERSEVVAYGFGDNFFRSVSIHGPLHNLPLAGVIDRRHSILSKSEYANTYRFLGIDECCRIFPAATYVVAVSWGFIEIQKALQERGIKDIVFI